MRSRPSGNDHSSKGDAFPVAIGRPLGHCRTDSHTRENGRQAPLTQILGMVQRRLNSLPQLMATDTRGRVPGSFLRAVGCSRQGELLLAWGSGERMMFRFCWGYNSGGDNVAVAIADWGTLHPIEFENNQARNRSGYCGN